VHTAGVPLNMQSTRGYKGIWLRRDRHRGGLGQANGGGDDRIVQQLRDGQCGYRLLLIWVPTDD
jgi:hypothetical protein